MSRTFWASGVLAVVVAICGSASIAQAGECENDWPNPYECFPDVLCNQFAQYWDLRRAVVHLYGPDIGGTGVLINTADCYWDQTDCGTPYLLTANHVVSGALGKAMTPGQMDDIQTLTAFTFGFEAATCGGPIATGAIALDGAQIVAQSPTADLLLLKLSTSLPPELGAYFVGWCDGLINQAVAISHPCGATKRIAVAEFGTIEHTQVMGRDVFDVYWWEEGAVASASSGAPLLDSSTGRLAGILTNTVQAGSNSCSNPNGVPAQDRFTAMSSILDFFPLAVAGGSSCIDYFDANEGAPILGTVEDSAYYGPGVVHEISATEAVWLIEGFFADAGSTITITATGAP